MIVALLREIYERRPAVPGFTFHGIGARGSQFVAFGPRALKPCGISINRSYSRYRDARPSGGCQFAVFVSRREMKLLLPPSARLNSGRGKPFSSKTLDPARGLRTNARAREKLRPSLEYKRIRRVLVEGNRIFSVRASDGISLFSVPTFFRRRKRGLRLTQIQNAPVSQLGELASGVKGGHEGGDRRDGTKDGDISITLSGYSGATWRECHFHFRRRAQSRDRLFPCVCVYAHERLGSLCSQRSCDTHT